MMAWLFIIFLKQMKAYRLVLISFVNVRMINDHEKHELHLLFEDAFLLNSMNDKIYFWEQIQSTEDDLKKGNIRGIIITCCLCLAFS